MIGPTLVLWIAFATLVVVMLAMDLGLFNRRDREQTAKEALVWSAVWIALSLGFAVAVGWLRGAPDAVTFVTAYLLEKSLSVDNIFVILLVFTHLGVPTAAQRRVLTWGIIGAVLLRGALILVGAELVQHFHFLLYGFGALLAYAGVKLLREKDGDGEEEAPPALGTRLLSRMMPLSTRYDGSRFTIVEDGVRKATPLLVALVTVELADVVFALDSIPAVFGVTTDPFLIFTSNLFAILGLRSLFFAVAAVLAKLAYLKAGLALVLLFIGAKMLLSWAITIPTAVSLGVIVALLTAAVVASLIKARREATAPGEVV